METKLTKEKLNAMKKGEIFAHGEIENSPDGVYMTDDYVGRTLVWAAIRGSVGDWAIYCNWLPDSLENVTKTGQKVVNKDNIRKLVDCTDEALNCYRF